MGSHLIDLPFWALKLREPSAVEASGAYRSTETYPQWLTVRWEHPATAERPGLTLTWYDGGKYPPSPPGIDLTQWGIGELFVGEKGQLVADYGRKVLLPAEKFKDLKPAKPTIPPSLGHYAEWLLGCRTGARHFATSTTPACSSSTTCSARSPSAWARFTWDAAAMKAAGCPEADPFIRRQYRKGWTI